MKAIAYVCCYNEADILPWTVAHLIQQGLHVHIIDNWSTDGSVDERVMQRVLEGNVSVESWPWESASKRYEWSAMLGHVSDLAYRSGADWCMLNDADEIRRSRPGERMVDAFARVEDDGYNAVDFQVFQFEPTDDDYKGNPEGHFRYYQPEVLDNRLLHIKAWRNIARVDLRSTGGHEAIFPGRRVYPQKFILKHYPLRTSAQAARKVMQERIPRYACEELAQDWHRQYDEVARSQQWIKDPARLRKWGQ